MKIRIQDTVLEKDEIISANIFSDSKVKSNVKVSFFSKFFDLVPKKNYTDVFYVKIVLKEKEIDGIEFIHSIDRIQ